MPFIHLSVCLLGVMTRSRPQTIGLTKSVSFTCSKNQAIRRLLFSIRKLILRLLLLGVDIKLVCLVVTAWSHIRKGICRHRVRYHLRRWDLTLMWKIMINFFLLLLYRSFQDKYVIRSPTRELVERCAFIILKVVVLGTWYGLILDHELIHSPLHLRFEVRRLNSRLYWRLSNLLFVCTWARWLILFVNGAISGIRCIECRYKTFLKILLLKCCIWVLICSRSGFLFFLSRYVENTFNFPLV